MSLLIHQKNLGVQENECSLVYDSHPLNAKIIALHILDIDGDQGLQ